MKMMIDKTIISFVSEAESPILICDKAGKVLFQNKYFEQVFNIDKSLLIDKNFTDNFTLSDNEKRRYKFRINETEELDVKCTINKFDSGSWIIVKKNSVKEYQRKLEAIINSAVDGIIIIDTKGIIEEINPAAAKVFGYEKQEVLGKNVKMLMPQNHSTRHDQYINNHLNTGVKKIIGIGREVWGLKKTGELFPFRLGISKVKLSDRIIFTGIIHDLSDRVRAEESELALKKEQQLNELKSRFVSLASHEFRTPLSTISSSIDLISSYEKPEFLEKRKKHINRIVSNVEVLTDILNDFLSISKLEEGKIKPQAITFNLKAMVNEILDAVEDSNKKRQIFVLEFNGSEQVYLDKKLLNNILLNLLSNSIKYSEENKTITISINVENTIEISVKDEGIGIPASEQNQLFERFFRANNVSNIQGTGLGLNIVKRYTELMNGEIYFSSIEGRGTTFNLQFPNNKTKNNN